MKHSEYRDDPHVRDFIKWSANIVAGRWRLDHNWHSPRHGEFDCDSLYEAHMKYDWDGSSFQEATRFLNRCREEVRIAMKATPATDEDKVRFLKTAIRIVEWGGIPGLKRSLTDMGREALQTLGDSASKLDPRCADIDSLRGFKLMRSGYSKIYSVMIKDFPIYDSRVACALTSLIWLFCRERHPNRVPETLRLGVPIPSNHKSVIVKWIQQGRPMKDAQFKNFRNPSDGNLQFPNIQGAQTSLYAISNLKAAWILGELAHVKGDFSTVCAKSRIRAIESAFFMLGYEPLDDNAIREA